MIIAATGHRPQSFRVDGQPISFNPDDWLPCVDIVADLIIKRQREYQYHMCCITGHAMFFDLIFGAAALKAQTTLSGKNNKESIEVWSFIPYPGHDLIWKNPKASAWSQSILSRSTNKVEAEHGFPDWWSDADTKNWHRQGWLDATYKKRDDMMVDESDELMPCFNGVRKGGTFHTLTRAEAQGKRILPNTYSLLAVTMGAPGINDQVRLF